MSPRLVLRGAGGPTQAFLHAGQALWPLKQDSCAQEGERSANTSDLGMGKKMICDVPVSLTRADPDKAGSLI